MVHRVQRTCLKRIGWINAESSSVSPLKENNHHHGEETRPWMRDTRRATIT
jgi:hypothetical protein